MTPAINDLRQALEYDADTGLLVWLPRPPCMKRWNSRNAGKVAGYIHREGYRVIKFAERALQAHRVAWALHFGDWPEGFIDHINGDRTDNRICNLRAVTRFQNMQNTRLNKKNKSGRIGVSFCKKRHVWLANIRVNNERIYLGGYKAFEDAVIARAAAEQKFGFHPNHGRRGA